MTGPDEYAGVRKDVLWVGGWWWERLSSVLAHIHTHPVVASLNKQVVRIITGKTYTSVLVL